MTAPIRLTDEQKSDLENWAAGFSGIRRPVTPALHGIVERIVAEHAEEAVAKQAYQDSNTRAGLREQIESERDDKLLVAEAAYRAGAAAAERALVERAAKVNAVHHFHGDECLCGFSSSRSRSRTEHITGAILPTDDRPDER